MTKMMQQIDPPAFEMTKMMQQIDAVVYAGRLKC